MHIFTIQKWKVEQTLIYNSRWLWIKSFFQKIKNFVFVIKRKVIRESAVNRTDGGLPVIEQAVRSEALHWNDLMRFVPAKFISTEKVDL
ncbi:hypothetical protein D3C75_979400 [compost metagenome]